MKFQLEVKNPKVAGELLERVGNKEVHGGPLEQQVNKVLKEVGVLLELQE